jgi:hypothetical protein
MKPIKPYPKRGFAVINVIILTCLAVEAFCHAPHLVIGITILIFVLHLLIYQFLDTWNDPD